MEDIIERSVKSEKRIQDTKAKQQAEKKKKERKRRRLSDLYREALRTVKEGIEPLQYVRGGYNNDKKYVVGYEVYIDTERESAWVNENHGFVLMAERASGLNDLTFITVNVKRVEDIPQIVVTIPGTNTWLMGDLSEFDEEYHDQYGSGKTFSTGKEAAKEIVRILASSCRAEDLREAMSRLQNC